MILVHYRDGSSEELDPSNGKEFEKLDSPIIQKRISRLSFTNNNGQRIDLPSMNGITRIWVELRRKNSEIRGERICMRKGRIVLKATLYYSDGRVVLNL